MNQKSNTENNFVQFNIEPLVFSNTLPPLDSSANQSFSKTKPIKNSTDEIVTFTRKHKRKWTKVQIEEMYEEANEYSQKNKRNLEELNINDFEIITKDLPQSSVDCMAKFFEIRKSGSFKSGVWPENEDDMLKELVLKKKS